MRILRIRQAETALADGRLDEAFELLADADLRSHRRGQELAGQVVEALLARGREHLAADRPDRALADCDRAIELGGNLPAAAELRAGVERAVSASRARRRREGDRLAAATEHIDQGRLTIGEGLLADGRGADGDDARAAALREAAAGRRAAAEAALAAAKAALDRGDLAAAMADANAAAGHRPGGEAVVAAKAEITAAGCERARADLVRGRLDLAESLLARLRAFAATHGEVEDLSRVAEQCRRGWRWVCRGELRRATEVLRRAEAMLPEAKWLKKAVACGESAAEATEALRAGPLGMLPAPSGPGAIPLSADAGDEPGAVDIPPQAAEEPRADAASGLLPAGGVPDTATSLPQRFALRVDGAGCFLVCRGRRVTLGPVSSSGRPDLGLLADASLPVVTLERTDGDYFLRAEMEVTVNDRPTRGCLLSDGDTIALSPRCRLRFRLPTPASGTGVLELTSARLPQADVRRVVLLDGEMILGPGSASHVRADHAGGRAVLHLRDDRLLCRTELPVTRGGAAMDATAPLAMDVPVRVGPVGVVLTRA